jgi:hypothetical protein
VNSAHPRGSFSRCHYSYYYWKILSEQTDQ